MLECKVRGRGAQLITTRTERRRQRGFDDLGIQPSEARFRSQ